MATWPIFPLISHNDLQTSISNMASSKNIARLNAEMALSCFEVSYWPIQIWYMPLQTVHSPYFSGRSSRSSTLCYRLPSWMSVKTNQGAGGGLGGSEKNSPWVVLTIIQDGSPVTRSLLRRDSLIILILWNSVGTFDHWSSQSLPKEISGAGK